MDVIAFTRLEKGDIVLLEWDKDAVQPYATHLSPRYVQDDRYEGHYFNTFEEALLDYRARCNATCFMVMDIEAGEAFGPFLTDNQALKSAVRRYRELDEDFEGRWLDPDEAWTKAEFAKMEQELMNAGVSTYQMTAPTFVEPS